MFSFRLRRNRRAFLTRRLVFQSSLGSRNSLDLEEGCRFSDFSAIATDDFENLGGHAALRHAQLAVLHLSVEEPLVDLDPVEAGLSHRTLSLLAIELAACHLVHAGQISDLSRVFAHPVAVAVGLVLFAQALPRDEGQSVNSLL